MCDSRLWSFVYIPDFIPWYPTPVVTPLVVTVNSVTLAIEQGSRDVPDGYVVIETIGYDVTCWSPSVLSNVAVWGSVVNVTVDKLLPDEQYKCDINVINKFGRGNFVTVSVTTSPSG